MRRQQLLAVLSVFGGGATVFLGLLMLFVGSTRFEVWAGFTTLFAGACAFVGGLVLLAYEDQADPGQIKRK